jgi:hypothetical protein
LQRFPGLVFHDPSLSRVFRGDGGLYLNLQIVRSRHMDPGLTGQQALDLILIDINSPVGIRGGSRSISILRRGHRLFEQKVQPL